MHVIAKANQISSRSHLMEAARTVAAWASFLFWMLSGRAKLD